MVNIAAIAAALAAIPGSLAAQDSAFDQPSKPALRNTVEPTERGHAIGDPNSETTLIEFVSYTCSHCADFARQGDPALELGFIAQGKLRLEIRPFIRNAIDLTVSMMVQCGGPEKVKSNHAMFLNSQDDWLEKAINAPQSQQAIWARGDVNARRNMANALGLTNRMTNRGYTPTQVNTCISDNAVAAKLVNNTAADVEEFAIAGTPSFALNGELLDQVHSWSTLYPALKTHFEALRDADREPELGESQFGN